MSDFIITSYSEVPGALSTCMQRVYGVDRLRTIEYHGTWGSIAVGRNPYHGFDPLETDEHIFAVIGGPVLNFRNNHFLTGGDSTEGTLSVYRRWLKGEIKWDEDLSGPFVVLIVTKQSSTIQCITDIMGFIPVYAYRDSGNFALATHLDTLAETTGQENDWDEISVTDFILNDMVTFPYTTYKNIRQHSPAMIVCYEPNGQIKESEYWLPVETGNYKSIDDAAKDVQQGLVNYVDKITDNMEEVAQFISGGEDSRALAGIIPPRLKRKYFIFLDGMNREGRIAQKIARSYGGDFYADYRSCAHYLDILESASDLVGAGHQYLHAHSLGFHRKWRLWEYPAVFGGFLSDTFLKCHHVHKSGIYDYFPFLPEVARPGYNPVGSRVGSGGSCFRHTEAVKERQQQRLSYMKSLRPHSYREWYSFLPASMPNFHSSRRLFRSYEPFMCNEVVKVSAAVPTSWKLNRRLFQRAVKPFLKPSRWVLHADGRLPYLPFWANVPLQGSVWFWHKLAKRLRLGEKGYPGPWADWKAVIASESWQAATAEYSKRLRPFSKPLMKVDPDQAVRSGQLNHLQAVNLMQVGFQMWRNRQWKRIAELEAVGGLQADPVLAHGSTVGLPKAGVRAAEALRLQPS